MVEVELESKLLFSHPVILTLWTAACQASVSLTISQSLPEFMSIASVMPSSRLILWCPLLFLPSVFPSIRDFSNKFALSIRWPKYWSFNFSFRASNQYSGFISLKIDWFDLAVQGALRSLFQQHHLKASVLQHQSKFLYANSHILCTMACCFCFPTFLTPYCFLHQGNVGTSVPHTLSSDLIHLLNKHAWYVLDGELLKSRDYA